MTLPTKADVAAFATGLGLSWTTTAAPALTQLYLNAKALEPPPPPQPPTPIPGLALVKTFEPDLTQPLSQYSFAGNPSGLFKTNLWFGSDGDNHLFNGSVSVWPDSPGSRAGGSDLQTYSDQAYNSINPFSAGPDGLTITAAKNPNPADPLTPNPYTSGIVTTQQTFLQRYGYFEADVSVPSVKGTWPAFWLLGEPYTPYQADEIDIAEFLGGTPGQVYQNAHSPRLGWNAPSAQAGFAGSRVTVGLLWAPASLTWYVNGAQAAQCPNPGLHWPMYVLANLAMGPKDGGWAALNTPVDDAHLPAKFTLHRLSVWRLP